MSNSLDLPCPSCGFLTLEGNYGNYDICDVCGWEDDGIQLANPCSGGGANGKSLAEAQQSSLNRYPLGVDLAEGIKRCKRWRPLTERELNKYTKQKANKDRTNKAVFYESETYWHKDL